MTKLLIVESPGKTKKIREFLGSGWQVEASYGHVRDLPEKALGVELTGFKPEYVPNEQGAKRIPVLKNIAANAEEIYLATDPDREGEAIAWHLQEVLGLKNPRRVTFQEITEKAVKQAVAAPRQIDMHLVHAQEARRVLDRLVGYPVSNALGNVLGRGVSAGRVQSPAVKIVVEREKAIKDFKVTTHFGVEFTFEAIEHVSTGWKALWKSKDFLAPDSEYILDRTLADKVAALKYFTVTSFDVSEKKEAPSAPFTTSALQQASSKKLKHSPKHTMELAQKLYEAGHITYMRTDSANLSADAVAEIQEFCRANDLPAAPEQRMFKVKAGSQEAHEAIRATHVEVETAGETDEEKALYKIIRIQAIASQMADAVYSVKKVSLQSEEQLESRPATLEASGRTLISAGWRRLVQPDLAEDEADELEADNAVPDLRPESRLLRQSSKVLTRQTKPPARFTEASLVRELENRGIGRPATYAAILENIIKYKGYLSIDQKRNLTPTEAGFAVVANLDKAFSFLDYDYTKKLEDGLDEVASGHKTYLDLTKFAYGQLSDELAAFNAQHAYTCPECGKPLRHLVKTGKDGYDFWGCSGHKDGCAYTAKNDAGKPGAKVEKKEQAVTEHKCPKCGKALIRRVSEGKKGPYAWYGCSGFKKDGCRASFFEKDGQPDFEGAKS